MLSEKKIGNYFCCSCRKFLKIDIFVVLGLFVTYGVFNGFEDIYQQAQKFEDFAKNTFNGLEGSINFAITSPFYVCHFSIARQFHTTIVEKQKEKHLKQPFGYSHFTF